MTSLLTILNDSTLQVTLFYVNLFKHPEKSKCIINCIRLGGCPIQILIATLSAQSRWIRYCRLILHVKTRGLAISLLILIIVVLLIKSMAIFDKNTTLFNYIIGNLIINGNIAWGYGFYTILRAIIDWIGQYPRLIMFPEWVSSQQDVINGLKNWIK